MRYHVVFYSPDRHLTYDGRTPDRQGVGGGVTSRIRMARALSRAGHRVTVVGNCPKATRIDGVTYLPLDRVVRIEGDVLLLNTSGGDLDLTPVLDLELNVGFTFIWTSGISAPGGLAQVPFDFLYAKSNFLRWLAIERWGVHPGKVFVAYNGFEEGLFRRVERRRPRRDPFRLAFFSHPSKGLDSAIAVLRRLRHSDPRFHLLVFGGPRLWGQAEVDPPKEEGLVYGGLIGQKRLAGELMTCSYSISLQTREEPFGMVITEAMRAGCVVLASPVGAYPELVRDGEDGFIIEGDPSSEAVWEGAASHILALTRNPDGLAYLRRNAQGVIWDTDTMARVWEGHWGWWFRNHGSKNREAEPSDGFPCPACGGKRLLLADGYHCVGCGLYKRHVK